MQTPPPAITTVTTADRSVLQTAAPTFVQDASMLQAFSCAQTAQTRDSLPPGFNTRTTEDYKAIISMPAHVQETPSIISSTPTPVFQYETPDDSIATWAQKQAEYHVRLAALEDREAKVAEEQARQALVASTAYAMATGPAVTEADRHAHHAHHAARVLPGTMLAPTVRFMYRQRMPH